MNFIPDPLHPAVVHFPIVLILLGAAIAMAAVFWRKSHLPSLAAVLLVLGALGTWWAVESGESAGGLLENGTPQLEALVDAHENWAKRTFTAVAVAAVAAAASALAGRWPRLARGAAICAALASMATVYSVYETGHRGGALVYQHAAGVQVAARSNAADSAAAPGKDAPGPESAANVKKAD
jgi:uncharacterized membrane protein